MMFSHWSNNLIQRSSEAFDMLVKLKRNREALTSDLGGKYQAQDIDVQALQLHENSTGLSYIR